MDRKKLVLIGAVALVVLGCVIAAGCTNTENKVSLPSGEWICTNFTTDDGRTVTAIQTIRAATGKGYWMEINGSNPGIQIDKVYSSVFSSADQDGTFKKASSSGKSYYMVYDPANDIVTQLGGITHDEDKVYTRLDPFVGIWSGIAPKNLGSGNATTIIKPDGIGVSVISYDNGSVRVAKLSWTKNTDGTYAVVFSDGAKENITVASGGKSLKTADGRTKTKGSYYPYPFVSVTGPWYSKDTGRLMIFNGDGTGIGSNNKGVLKFTWKMNDGGKCTVAYTDGIGEDGTSLKDKTFEWTYDRDNDVFTSSKGLAYTHPRESVAGKITLA